MKNKVKPRSTKVFCECGDNKFEVGSVILPKFSPSATTTPMFNIVSEGKNAMSYMASFAYLDFDEYIAVFEVYFNTGAELSDEPQMFYFHSAMLEHDSDLVLEPDNNARIKFADAILKTR